MTATLNGAIRFLIRTWNGARGYGFSWVKTPGSPAGGYIEPWCGTCPYPVINDWSARACIKAGHCGCSNRVSSNGSGK